MHMKDAIRTFVISRIEKKSKLPTGGDMDDLDYMAAGYVDSMGIIKFILEIESEFDITISDDDLESPEFRTIGGLVRLIKSRIEKKDGA